MALDPYDIRLSRIRALRGPNAWHSSRVITCELNTGGYETLDAADRDRIARALISIVPSLPAARVTGHSIPTQFGVTALELQRLAGSTVSFIDVRDTLDRHWTRVTIDYEDEETARQALDDATDILRAAAAGQSFDLPPVLANLRDLRARRSLGAGAGALVAEAKRRSIPVRRFEDDDTIQLGLGRHLRRIEVGLASGAGQTLDEHFPADVPASIPILAVTGTNGKTTTTRLIAHLFRRAGYTVGYTTTDGTYIGDRLVDTGDNTGPFSANIVLSSDEIDVAVLEVARGGIIRAGLGVDELDVGVVLNVTSDHLGIDDIGSIDQLAQVKGVIPAIVKETGVAVLNADDELVAAMRTRTRARIAWFTTGRTDRSVSLRDHATGGGLVAGIDDDHFVIARGADRMSIAPIRDVALTVGGAARFQYENILAALLAGASLGLEAEQLRSALISFVPSPDATPGRLNIVDTPRGQIIVDYAHNAAAIRGLVDFVGRLDARVRIAVIGAPGDRRDDDLREVGRLFGGFDHVIVKEVAKYRRGRRPGETAALIAQGLSNGGLRADRIEVVEDEPLAVERALELMQSHSIVVILADDHTRVLTQLKSSIG